MDARGEFSPDMSTKKAARRALSKRMRVVAQRIAPVADQTGDDPEPIHRLRVATRRATACLDAFGACLPGKRAKRVKKMLKGLRQAAGGLRDLDVLDALFRDLAVEEPAIAPALGDVIVWCEGERGAARARIAEAVEACPPRRVKRAGLWLEASARKAEIDGEKYSDLGAYGLARIEALNRGLAEWAELRPRTPESLHNARIEAKRLRYALEWFGVCLDPEVAEGLRADLRALHDAMGGYNDLVVMGARLEELAGLGVLDEGRARAVMAALEPRRESARGEAERLLDAFGSRWLGPSESGEGP